MDRQDAEHTVAPFSIGRQIMIDALSRGRRKHNIHGLVEVDVTQARQAIHEHEAATGTQVSFTAFIITCLGKAVDMNRHVQAYRKGRNQVVVFDDVDVNTTVEIEIEGELFPILHIIRAVNNRTYLDISQELHGIRDQGETSQDAQKSKGGKIVAVMPPAVRRLFFRWVLANPQRAKQLAGTVLLTSVGMFGKGAGWGIPFGVQHPLAVTVGGIAEKPVVIDGRIEIREVMSVTLSFDHAVVDGAPAARFAETFKELIESGYGLTADDEERHASRNL